MPDQSDREMYKIVEDGSGTWAVVLANTTRPVVVDGVSQEGFDIQDAEDIADHLEAIARITASRRTGTVN